MVVRYIKQWLKTWVVGNILNSSKYLRHDFHRYSQKPSNCLPDFLKLVFIWIAKTVIAR